MPSSGIASFVRPSLGKYRKCGRWIREPLAQCKRNSKLGYRSLRGKSETRSIVLELANMPYVGWNSDGGKKVGGSHLHQRKFRSWTFYPKRRSNWTKTMPSCGFRFRFRTFSRIPQRAVREKSVESDRGNPALRQLVSLFGRFNQIIRRSGHRTLQTSDVDISLSITAKHQGYQR